MTLFPTKVDEWAKYNEWIPGVLSMKQVKLLVGDGFIDNASSSPRAFDHSSIDLHLTAEGYHLPEGAIKPSGPRYFPGVKGACNAERLATGEDGSFLLIRQKTYIFKVKERLVLRDFNNRVGGIHGQATAKSSVGRVDVLARLIVDGARDYEGFSPEDFDKGSGDMFVEITPITFNVRVMAGTSVNQLRLFLGSPDEAELRGKVLFGRVLLNPAGQSDGSLSVDLSDSTVSGIGGAALVAKPSSGEPIPLWTQLANERPNPCDFWKLLSANAHDRLTIDMNNFYILRSRERIALPKGVAVYCRASDETIGEMRIHYAGFVHPFFGYDRQDGTIGTPLIFEVRGHNVNVSLINGERMAKLIFYRMSEDAERDDTTDKSYNEQQLQLSKFFGDWPSGLKRLDDGTLVPAE
jgi:dCTP deaminase